MTLRRVRTCLRQRVAAITGVGYVAITRVKHLERLVFSEGLPPWEKFQASRLMFPHGRDQFVPGNLCVDLRWPPIGGRGRCRYQVVLDTKSRVEVVARTGSP